MSPLKSTLGLLGVVAAYCIAGRLDYDAAVMLDEIERQSMVIVADDCLQGEVDEAQTYLRPCEPRGLDRHLPRDATRSAGSAIARPVPTPISEEPGMRIETQRRKANPPMLAVRSTEDLEYLVKESEVLTGLPGRTFVIAGADRLTYRLLWHPQGFKVQRLDDRVTVLHTQHLLNFEFLDHSLLEALRAGQLFTVPVDAPPRCG